MANPIKGTDIANANAFDKFIDGAKKTKVVLSDLLKGLVAIGKQQQKNIEIIKKRPDTIKKTKELDKAIKETDKTVKSINKTRERSIKLGKQLEASESKRIGLRTKEAKQIEANNRISRERNAINKEQAVLNNKTAGTLEKLAIKNKQLIRIRKGLNLETKKGRDRLKAINEELDKNNKRIKQNVSQLEKQKIGIGDYSGGLKEAAGASGLFGGVLSKLTAVQGVLNALTKKNLVASKADVIVKNSQAAATTKLSIAQRASALATGIGTKAMRIFKFALISTGIGAIVVALGAMVAFFTRSQKGIDFLSVKMAQMGAVVDVVIDAFAAFGESMFDAFSKPSEIIEGLIEFIKKIPGLVLDNIINRFLAFGVILQAIIDGDLKGIADGFLQLGTGIEDFSDKAEAAINNITEASIRAIEVAKELAAEMAEKARIAGILKELTIDLTREEALFSAQQATTITQIKELVLISKDKLKIDEVRIAALKQANALEIALGDRQLELAKESLAAALDGLSTDEKSLKNDAARLKFIEDIKNGTIGTAEAIEKAAAFTLSSAQGEEALFEIIEKIKTIEQERQNIIQLQTKTTRQLSSLQVQIATKNATAFTREAAALRQQATERERTIEDRIRLISEAAELEIQSFEVQVVANIKNARELAAAKVQIESKLQQDIAKLREATENTQAIAAEKRRIKAVEELRQEDIEAQIEAKERELENTENLTIEKEIEIINEIFELRKKALEAADEFARARFDEAAAARIKAIENNEKLTEEQRREAIKKEEEATNAERILRAEIFINDIKNIEQGRVDAVKDANQQILDDDKTTNDKRKAEAEKLAKAVARAFSTLIKERNKENIELIDAEIKRAQTAVDRQTEIAEKGQINILGEEQARLDKANLEKRREAERAAKQEQNIALATAFLNNFAARTKTDPKTAFALAVRDTIGAKLFAEALASFYDGTEDTGTTSNPLDSKGGRKVIVHDNERIMTKKDNEKVGNMSNEKLADLAYDYQHGNLQLSPSHFKQIEVGNMMKPDSMSGVIAQMKNDTAELKKAFADGQVKYHVHWNEYGEAREIMEKKRIKKAVTFKRSRIG